MNRKCLETGVLLHNNAYEIELVIGEGGFGITYLGKRLRDEYLVTIKEYFPGALAVRGQTEALEILEGEAKQLFYTQQQAFVKEAELLGEFRHLPGVAMVLDFFEENNTTYMVMEYIEGVTLKEYIEQAGGIPFSRLFMKLRPMMQSLIMIHKYGVIHRDISPENIIVDMNQNLWLIDFGAAYSIHKDVSQEQPVILKEGYAPPEQYISNGKQGAWTDVYALAATMYAALTTKTPPASVKRLQGDRLQTIRSFGVDISSWQEAAILKGMELEISKRYGNMGQFYDALMLEPSLADVETQSGVKIVDRKIKRLIPQYRKTGYFRTGAFLIIIILLVSSFMLLFLNNQMAQEYRTTENRLINQPQKEIQPEDGQPKQITISENKVPEENQEDIKESSQPEQDVTKNLTKDGTDKSPEDSGNPAPTQKTAKEAVIEPPQAEEILNPTVQNPDSNPIGSVEIKDGNDMDAVDIFE